MSKPLMVALDFSELADATTFLQSFTANVPANVKVGMELFYRYGPQVVTEIQELGSAVFLDLKLFDIPHTVEKALEQLGRLGVAQVTVHALGGTTMMQAARRGLDRGAKAAQKPRPQLLAVTELTSISATDLASEQHCQLPMTEQVIALAQLAVRAGCDGVITSALEVKALRAHVPNDFKLVVPGIRLASDAVADQQRVATPMQASQAGADAIVVGRPITQSDNPVFAYQRYQQAWQDQGGENV
ncbi:orotidine-5'-phosphate decarboxylase [Fructilactobacillus florum]|uniref:orotidine-5'-phosphate decarboxylase n=1 Tax=Fructilactobacillus florum TaxID=640331 RepID=UPI0002FBAEB1